MIRLITRNCFSCITNIILAIRISNQHHQDHIKVHNQTCDPFSDTDLKGDLNIYSLPNDLVSITGNFRVQKTAFSSLLKILTKVLTSLYYLFVHMNGMSMKNTIIPLSLLKNICFASWYSFIIIYPSNYLFRFAQF